MRQDLNDSFHDELMGVDFACLPQLVHAAFRLRRGVAGSGLGRCEVSLRSGDCGPDLGIYGVLWLVVPGRARPEGFRGGWKPLA